MTQPKPSERSTWDHHWRGLARRGSLFGLLASLVRRFLLRPTVARYARRWFPRRGIFVEAGCGTSEASLGVDRADRSTVGLDFSITALALARRHGLFDSFVCADIRRLPFRSDAISGIWNLGVMEHFEPEECEVILGEFHRVLEPEKGRVLLFWPPTYGLSRWVLAPFEWWRSRRDGAPFRFFPDEVNRLGSRDEARRVLAEASFETERADFGPRDGFNHLILVARRSR